MARVKRGIMAQKRRAGVLQHTKGFRWGRKSKFRLAKDALLHGWTRAYKDRKNKKRVFRALWQVQINAACRVQGLSYSKFIGNLKKAKIEVDRKILSQIANKKPEVFKQIIERIK